MRFPNRQSSTGEKYTGKTARGFRVSEDKSGRFGGTGREEISGRDSARASRFQSVGGIPVKSTVRSVSAFAIPAAGGSTFRVVRAGPVVLRVRDSDHSPGKKRGNLPSRRFVEADRLTTALLSFVWGAGCPSFSTSNCELQEVPMSARQKRPITQ